MKLKAVFCFALILSACSVSPIRVSEASFQNSAKVCWPDDAVFLQNMKILLERTPETLHGDIPIRSIEVGTRYQEGDVAYFVGSGDAAWMQLEEWRMRPDRIYQLTTWRCEPHYAETWSLALSPEDGQLMDDNKIVYRDLDIASPEAIEKSEKIQKILRDAFPGL